MHMFLGSAVKRKIVFLESQFVYADNALVVVHCYCFVYRIICIDHHINMQISINVQIIHRVAEKVILDLSTG